MSSRYESTAPFETQNWKVLRLISIVITADYWWKVDGELFELDVRYKITNYLGAGAYGVVCSGIDVYSNQTIAIKKCKNM